METFHSITELCLSAVATGAFYVLSNMHTYNIGSSMPCAPPLHDFFHDILPDLSASVKVRDYILPIFFIPLFFLNCPWEIVMYFVEGFMYLVTLKAITIFFTFIPPSNRRSAEKKELNHCYHQMFSGHNSLIALLCCLYLMYSSSNTLNIVFVVCTILYSLFILMTRAHYTVDIIVSYIVVLFLFDRKT